ncbi:MAG: DUF1648 domain-containing protein [Bacteroidetes bacterium]|nr:DUF1648 domain-containing protein [Bacteroidota bacterium]
MFPKNRPIINVPSTETNRFLNWFIVLLLMVYIAYVFTQFNALPDTIPTHFGKDGVADSYGAKKSIWLLPGIALLMSIGLSIASKYPHLFNYPVKVTHENAFRLYSFGIKLIQFTSIYVILLFFYISYVTIKIANNPSSEGLHAGFLPIIIVSSLLFTVFVLFKINTLK